MKEREDVKIVKNADGPLDICINICTSFAYKYSCCVCTFLIKYGKKIYFIKIYLERKSNGKKF